jgi:hypothetical protein
MLFSEHYFPMHSQEIFEIDQVLHEIISVLFTESILFLFKSSKEDIFIGNFCFVFFVI